MVEGLRDLDPSRNDNWSDQREYHPFDSAER
jgi:hypothetical protein